MEKILNFIPNLKILYLFLIILVMVIINIILTKKRIGVNYRYFINGISLILLALLTSYSIDIINGIFSFNYLSVKFYMIILIITNIITLITINRDLKLVYKIINYILFSLMSLLLIANIVIIVGTKLMLLSSVFSSYNIILLNLSIIIFIVYLIIISLVYILKNIDAKEEGKEVVSKDILEKIKVIKVRKGKRTKEKDKIIINGNILSNEELLAISNKDEFSINGVECSIIFEDSVPDNIIKNYHILLNDINAKMVNGYTLDENRLLKSICTKLQTNNLNNIDLSNLSILNKISVEEYNLLKQIYER